MADVSVVALPIVLLLILGAEFVNGWTDAPNAVATVVGTRSLSPLQAVLMAAVLNFAGVLSGTAVATTIAKDIIDPQVVDLATVAGAMLGIIIWSTFAAWLGIPTSESHALIAGLSGAGMATAGPGVLLWVGWKKTLLGLIFSTGDHHRVDLDVPGLRPDCFHGRQADSVGLALTIPSLSLPGGEPRETRHFRAGECVHQFGL